MSEKEFEHIFKTRFNQLCYLSSQIVKDSDAAHDVVQNVFLKIWDKLNTLQFEISAEAYLKRAVVNASLNYLEKQKKLKFEDDLMFFEEEEIVTDTELNPDDLKEKINAAIQTLPPKCQTVFSLSRFSGFTNQEIADDLNIGIKAVEKHITSALKALRDKLKPVYKSLYVNFLFLW